MSDRANVNPKILKWARETAKFTLEAAAGKVPVPVAKLAEWESGVSQPTINQAEKLAKTYRRPFALFFFPEPPMDFQPLQDFRLKSAKPLSTASTFIIRETQQRQSWIRDLYKETDETDLSFVGKFTLNDDPSVVAHDMLATLNIQPARYSSSSPIREWIEKAEANGIFISRTSYIHSRLTLDSDELQGFAIADRLAPFVFINSEDWDAPQLFTLVHELAHIWIAASGISNAVEPELHHRDKLHPVEIFCNHVAASALMPEGLMRGIPADTFRSAEKVFSAARRFGVSSFALIYLAYSLALVNNSRYRQLKHEADNAFQEYVQRETMRKAAQKKREGGPDYYMLLVSKNSSLFTKVVLNAFHGGSIQPTEASGLLNTSTNNFSKLEAYLYK